MGKTVTGRVKASNSTKTTATRLSSPPQPAPAIQAKGEESGDPVEQRRRASRVGHDFARLKVGAEPRGQAGGARPLPEIVRRKAENALGIDVSSVRLRVNRTPHRFEAEAFTHGNSITVIPERYRPDSRAGQELLLHELAHVKQQRAGRVAHPQGKGAPVNTDPTLEAEADAVAETVASGETLHSGAGHIGNAQRNGGSYAVSAPDAALQLKGKSKSWQRRRRARLAEEERQRQAARQETAATKIQSAFRGYRQRKQLAAELQGDTSNKPYKTGFEYHAAANNYSIAAWQRDPRLRSSELKVYQDTSGIAGTGRPAVLHKMGGVYGQQLENYIHGQGTGLEEAHQTGRVYDPKGGQHDMRTNSAWLLGLAHNQAPIHQIAPLNPRTVRRNNPSGDLGEGNVPVSALAREAIALTDSRYYTATPHQGGTVDYALNPGENPMTAKLEDFQAPKALTPEVLGQRLGDRYQENEPTEGEKQEIEEQHIVNFPERYEEKWTWVDGRKVKKMMPKK